MSSAVLGVGIYLCFSPTATFSFNDLLEFVPETTDLLPPTTRKVTVAAAAVTLLLVGPL